jgi:hypothetical protein
MEDVSQLEKMVAQGNPKKHEIVATVCRTLRLRSSEVESLLAERDASEKNEIFGAVCSTLGMTVADLETVVAEKNASDTIAALVQGPPELMNIERNYAHLKKVDDTEVLATYERFGCYETSGEEAQRAARVRLFDALVEPITELTRMGMHGNPGNVPGADEIASIVRERVGTRLDDKQHERKLVMDHLLAQDLPADDIALLLQRRPDLALVHARLRLELDDGVLATSRSSRQTLELLRETAEAMCAERGWNTDHATDNGGLDRFAQELDEFRRHPDPLDVPPIGTQQSNRDRSDLRRSVERPTTFRAQNQGAGARGLATVRPRLRDWSAENE